jgi:hypothetical protein
MKNIEKTCGNCKLFNKNTEMCTVSILLDGEKHNMPVNPNDNCHMEELGIEVNQVRWWVEDPITGEPTNKNGIVKMEYPEGFFGKMINEL